MIFEIYVTNASISGVCAVPLGFETNIDPAASARLSHLPALRPIYHCVYPTDLHSSYLVTLGRISFLAQPPVHPKTQEAHGIVQTAARVLAFWNVLVAETSLGLWNNRN
jgi:hypothetical protein